MASRTRDLYSRIAPEVKCARQDSNPRPAAEKVVSRRGQAAAFLAFYPPPDITPSEFEEFVAGQLLGSAEPEVSNLHISLHEKITGTDGTYELSFLVLVEAKLHKNPIKRELVQVLYQTVQSAGAHKGVMVSTAPHQTGAVRFAQVHGIALATVTEGRFLYEARDALPTPQLSRAEAAARLGYPTFISHYYESGDKMGSIRVWSLLPGDDEYTRDVADLLLGAENLPRKITAQGSAVAQQPTSRGTRPLRPEANTLRRVPG